MTFVILTCIDKLKTVQDPFEATAVMEANTNSTFDLRVINPHEGVHHYVIRATSVEESEGEGSGVESSFVEYTSLFIFFYEY